MAGQAVDQPVPYEQGLHEVADGVLAYLQPDGGWGWSNAGLLAGDWSSLLVDTLFDLRLTRAMLGSMDAVTAGRPIDVVVNTHANGDHCYGNGLLAAAGAEVVTTEAAAAEIGAVPPSAIEALLRADLGEPANRYVREAFGPFDFAEVVEQGGVPEPDRTFSGELQLDVGGRTVELLEVGPAHTAGDLLVHVPGASTVFCGDILFVGGTPIVWEGPVANWIGACDRILGLGCDVIVPGHGPLTDAAGVTAVRDYLLFVLDECRARHAAGQAAEEAIAEIDLGPYREWGEWERIVVNVHAVYRELAQDLGRELSQEDENVREAPVNLFAAMAELRYGRHPGGAA